MGKGVGELLYVHMNASERFVMMGGLDFQDFYASLSQPLQNILLLKHRYKDAEYNMHTALEFVEKENVPKLVKSMSEQNGEFCWIDFEEDAGLSSLEGREIAELLYLGHIKHHLRPPFYRMLNNEYAYLSNEDGTFSKVYFKDIGQFYTILGKALPDKMGELRVEKKWFGFKKKSEYPDVPRELFSQLGQYMEEGIVFALERIAQTRNRLEIPIWVIGDCVDADEVVDGYRERTHQAADAKLIYIKKTKEWALVGN